MVDVIHDPGNKRGIGQLYVFMSIDDNGFNGILGADMGIGFTQLVTAEPKLIEPMKTMALKISRESGKRVGLFVFKRDGDPIWSLKDG
jgi:hypothetical protein